MKRWFLTVDWCNKGKRGIFANKNGNPFSKEAQHTEEEMWDILDAFAMILNPYCGIEHPYAPMWAKQRLLNKPKKNNNDEPLSPKGCDSYGSLD